MNDFPTTPPVHPYAVNRDDTPSFYLIGISWPALSTGALTGNRLLLKEKVCHSGSGPPMHTHEQGEGFCIIDGTARFLIGDRTVESRAGLFVWVPCGAVHDFRVDSRLPTCRRRQ